MRHHEHGAPLRAHRLQRGDERGVAGLVEVGVRFVQHDERRIAVERSRQRDALPLASGKGEARFPQRGVIALRQTQDEVMHIGALRRFDDARGIRLLEARDVFGDRALEELDVLRQIADPGADLIASPDMDLRPVQANGARQRRPHADKSASQRGFAGRAGTDDRDHAARLGSEAQCLENGVRAAGRCNHEVFDRHCPCGPRQRDGGSPYRLRFEQSCEARVCAARGDEAAPCGDSQIDRGQRAAEEDRGRDHSAGAQLVVDHEQSA